MVELIKRKRDGGQLTKAEISEIITGFTEGSIPDYQMSAFMMAVYFSGMTIEETAMLTDEMMRSGDLIDLSDIAGIKVDKHSTGGVGDKTTIVLAPLVAAAGVPVAKMSGRGLGHTGGTLDKLEAIEGLSVDMTKEDFIKKIKQYGLAVCGQNANLVPADKKMYALRDVTATVNNFALIASSIMSKKLACGAEGIVIDIKVGEGAYMKTLSDAEQLAKLLIGIGKNMGREVVAVATAMHEPLGFAVGNALEVKEAIDTLKGKGPKDLTDLCLELGSQMLVLGKVAKNKKEAVAQLEALINSGAALEKFKEFVGSQGGDTRCINHTDALPQSTHNQEYTSKTDGYITELDALKVGLASMKLGAGRETKKSIIELGAGIVLKKKIGDYAKQGEALATLYSNDPNNFEKANLLLDEAYILSDKASPERPLILKTFL